MPLVFRMICLRSFSVGAYLFSAFPGFDMGWRQTIWTSVVLRIRGLQCIRILAFYGGGGLSAVPFRWFLAVRFVKFKSAYFAWAVYFHFSIRKLEIQALSICFNTHRSDLWISLPHLWPFAIYPAFEAAFSSAALSILVDVRPALSPWVRLATIWATAIFPGDPCPFVRRWALTKCISNSPWFSQSGLTIPLLSSSPSGIALGQVLTSLSVLLLFWPLSPLSGSPLTLTAP